MWKRCLPIALLCCLASGGTALAEEKPAGVARGEQAMVVSVSAAATDAGVEALRRGGTAVDAAVSVAFMLAVTWPEAGNIGGGGFMMVQPAPGQTPVCVEYRETAPAGATAEMFAAGTDMKGHVVVGVPGTVAGLALAHQRFGKLTWRELVEPAAAMARDGFVLDATLAGDLNELLAGSGKFAELRRVYGRADGQPWKEGDRLVLPELGATLARIAVDGPEAFYRGAIAEAIVAEMQAGGGLITREDLARYRANVREPVHGTYRGFDIYGPPPPSSGGTVVVTALNILETFNLKERGRWSPETVHLITEAMRRAYADRARWLGDPDRIEIPTDLTSKEHARELAATIDLARATPSAAVAPGIELAKESASTTHFSIVDAEGMAVANTYTLENSYGSRVVVRGAGFLLNNEMTDFNHRPGYTNRKGAIGTPANTIEPGKRMLSSQSPTLVLRDGRPVLITGSPGGRTIPNTVLCTVVGVLEFDEPLEEAVAAPRLHHAWFPDKLNFEGAKDEAFAALVARLREMGHVVGPPPEGKQGDAHSIQFREGAWIGVADGRRAPAKAAGMPSDAGRSNAKAGKKKVNWHEVDPGPASEAEVAAVEKKLGVALPEDYRKFLLMRTKRGIRRSIRLLSRDERVEPLTLHWPSDDRENPYELTAERDFVPEGYLQIGEDDTGNSFCIKLRDPQRGQVIYWESFRDESDLKSQIVAHSFKEFLERLGVKLEK